MTPPPAMAPSGSIGLSSVFFVAAGLFLTCGAAGLIWIAPDLAAATFLVPRVAGVTHLFTLGWVTMMIFGALYQLLPVALGAPIRWQRVAQASWWTFAPGVPLFASGVALQSNVLQHAGACLVGVGIALVLINVVSSLRRAANHDATWLGIALAFTCLVSTFAIGFVLIQNLHTGFVAADRVRILVAHLHIAIVGWALMMIVGVSHRLMPMFLLAHRADVRWTKRALISLFVGVVALATGVLTSLIVVRWIGVAALAAGLGAFLMQATAFYRARVRKHLDSGLRFVAGALGFLALAALLGLTFAVLPFGRADTVVGVAYVVAALVGGLTIFIVGFAYKIVPLLVWTAAYRGQMGKAAVPLVADMYSARAAEVQLALMAAGVVLLIASVLARSAVGAYIGASLFFIGTLVFIAQFVRVGLHLRTRHNS
jgi:hypothetical protein